jgi:hypothetical protein
VLSFSARKKRHGHHSRRHSRRLVPASPVSTIDARPVGACGRGHQRAPSQPRGIALQQGRSAGRFLLHHPRTDQAGHSLEAIDNTTLLFIGQDAVFGLLEKDPSFSRKLLAGLSLRLHSLLLDVESYSLRSSTQRVIGYLLQHCPNEGNVAGRIEITLPTSKQIIASRLNLTPETLSRILHELAQADLIAVQGKQITIGDLKRLREYDL